MSDYDLQALKGAAEFFENMATGADPAPLAFAQAIRRVIEEEELVDELAEEFATEGSEVGSNYFERFKASLPVAKIINDNQPGRQAVIELLRDPPTLPVGTLLFASPQAATDNQILQEALADAFAPASPTQQDRREA